MPAVRWTLAIFLSTACPDHQRRECLNTQRSDPRTRVAQRAIHIVLCVHFVRTSN